MNKSIADGWAWLRTGRDFPEYKRRRRHYGTTQPGTALKSPVLNPLFRDSHLHRRYLVAFRRCFFLAHLLFLQHPTFNSHETWKHENMHICKRYRRRRRVISMRKVRESLRLPLLTADKRQRVTKAWCFGYLAFSRAKAGAFFRDGRYALHGEKFFMNNLQRYRVSQLKTIELDL